MLGIRQKKGHCQKGMKALKREVVEAHEDGGNHYFEKIDKCETPSTERYGRFPLSLFRASCSCAAKSCLLAERESCGGSRAAVDLGLLPALAADGVHGVAVEAAAFYREKESGAGPVCPFRKTPMSSVSFQIIKAA